ncbi:hypothetical protein PGUG_00308 [Meyerozyma guilliermondii ATCC 6260]|uniref:protein-tyrosine-phosphatase n=1 Tax=Meyerozyma guilliermondii (strain ATCC 6260 / CBS 566 / DSM 6381 / JCM 1539 / NBRC 10279 / NRRL Y-324) TaxID=294746 RepID=A5DAK3_PICGU|nr:uncharacterized protein PGUG_00308 [Meyerozyma guilliermondii ATCC 6260]EDK36210.2 hypothetical protein PGUG_00308 [Meyerozyma guilliermondii ATCC 6260]
MQTHNSISLILSYSLFLSFCTRTPAAHLIASLFHHMLHRILGGIYLSSYEPLRSNENLDAYNITHILSVVPGPIPESYTTKYQWKQVPILDLPTENIIQYFPECNDFIDRALFPEGKQPGVTQHGGAVLVHCQEGVSRSVTVVMAYLMYHYKLSVSQSLHAVKRRNGAAEPNTGFMEQLQLYFDMNLTLDTNNPDYKKLLVNLNLRKDPSGKSLMDIYGSNTSPQDTPKVHNAQLRCKRCRQVLALSSQIETHVPPEADSRQAQFIKTAPNSRRIIDVKPASPSCSHYFLTEPLNWMKDELQGKGELDGKFQCPKCNSKVGGYSWKGTRCSCGRWMIPALHVQTAKVDFVKTGGSQKLVIGE